MDYENYTAERIAAHFGTVTRQRIQQILSKYQKRGDEATVAKIQRAKDLLKVKKYNDKNGYTVEAAAAASTIYAGVLDRAGKHVSYKDCTVAFTSGPDFCKWAIKQIGFDVDGFELDKDILVKGNRVYGPDTCVFLPVELNSLFSGCYKAQKRGQYPIGVSYNRGSGAFVAQMSNRQEKGLTKYLGSFPTVEEAFACYKEAKEARIKILANKWKDKIDPRAYAALMARTVDLDD